MNKEDVIVLAQTIGKKSPTQVVALSVLLATSFSAQADSSSLLPWEHNSLMPTGPYFYGQLGYARAATSREAVEQEIQAVDPTVDVVSIKRGGAAWSLGAGYQLSGWLSAELGWLDLGDRDVTLPQGSTFAASEHAVSPQSGQGPSLSVVTRMPVFDNLSLGTKLGVWHWQDTDGLTGNSSSDTRTWYGLDASYHTDHSVAYYASWQRFDLPRDDVNLFSLGLRYFFGEPSAPALTARKSTALSQANEPVNSVSVLLTEPVRLADDDNDGVVNIDDVCPQSPEAFAVDSRGCTLFEQQQLTHRLVINYANDSALIPERYDAELEVLFEFVRQYDIQSIDVVGHTSAPGDAAYNLSLSRQRAESVSELLNQRYGINPYWLVAQGKGETELLAEGNDEVAHELNRRTEIIATTTVMQEVLR